MLVTQAQEVIDLAPQPVDQTERWMQRRLPLRDGQLLDQALSQVTNVASTEEEFRQKKARALARLQPAKQPRDSELL